VFALAWVFAGHREPAAHWRAFGKGLAVAAAVSLLLLAYPLWLQFFGAQTYHGTGFNQRVHAEDVLAYGAYPRRSIAGQLGLANNLAPNPTEENSFFGLPLLVLVVGISVALRRNVLVRALAATAAVFAVLSLGPAVKFDGVYTHIPLPYAAVARLPLFDSALPSRLALVVVPIVGVLLGLAIDAAPAGRPKKLLAAGLAVALVPLVPVPLLIMERSGVPSFITSGDWRRYVAPGETLVPVPPVADLLPDGQRWQAFALSTGDGQTFRVPGGFFLGPGGPDGHGLTGPVPRYSYALLKDVALTGHTYTIGDGDRRLALADLRFWRGHVVVLPVSGGTGNRWSANQGALLATTTALFGPPTRVDDVWLWRVDTTGG
jgi:hypothetical protein